MDQDKEQQTKTVDGHFGPKRVTREQFIQRWADHFAECVHLTDTTAEFDEFVGMKQRIKELAGAKWDRLK